MLHHEYNAICHKKLNQSDAIGFSRKVSPHSHLPILIDDRNLKFSGVRDGWSGVPHHNLSVQEDKTQLARQISLS